MRKAISGTLSLPRSHVFKGLYLRVAKVGGRSTKLGRGSGDVVRRGLWVTISCRLCVG